MNRRIARLMALVAGSAATVAQAQSITTVFTGVNGGNPLWTVYFNVTVNTSMTFNSFAVNTTTAAGQPLTLNIYTTGSGGTYLGNESNAGAWTLQATGAGLCAGTDVPSLVDTSDFVLGPGTYGMAIRYMDATPRYTDGNGSNQNYSNPDISLALGAAQATTVGPFNGGTPFTPRVANMTINYTLGGVTGACCLGAPTYACVVTTQTSCTNQGGSYAGNAVTCAAANCPPPPTGACCTQTGTCSVGTQLACINAGGIYAGNNVTCAAANCQPTVYNETSDAGDLPGTSAQVSAAGQVLQKINGNLSAGDGDMYHIKICDAANFSATTVGNGNTLDTILSLYKADGNGVAWNDDEVGGTSLQSRLTNQFVTAAGNGEYYIHVSQFNKIPFGAGGNIWINDGIAVPYRTERAPDGPGAPGPITGWNAPTGTGTGAYTIAFTGACFLGNSNACYPNCDLSTAPPVLNANDFQCFLNEFAAQTPYANCDLSTAPPVLNANDFQCFLNAFAGGCS